MEAVKILDHPAEVTLNYDQEADVLYISAGPPVPALGVDIGDGIILRYDEPRREVVGLTVLGVKARLLQGLGESRAGTPE